MKPGAKLDTGAGGPERTTHAIGVDIGGTKTAVSLWTLGGELLGKRRFATEGPSDMIIGAIGALARLLALESGIPLEAVAGVGISCGGPLDSSRGLVLSPPNLPSWDRVPIAAALAASLGRPCFLENDANACALAEWHWGAGRGCRNMVFLTFGTGLGAGLILDGRLYRGACDLAGEVGHVRMAQDGPVGYGKRGSWEGLCSGGGISRLYEEETGSRMSAKEICDDARSGEAAALRIIDKSATYLGRGIAMLIDVLNPDCVVIGSVFARSEDLFRPAMEAAIEAESLPAARAHCVVLPAALGELLGDMAALGVVLDRRERG
jgi:glucokinase